MKRVLLLEGDFTQALPTAKSLQKHGYVVDGVFGNKWSYGYGSRYINKKYLFADTADTLRYSQFLYEVLATHHYDAVIPLNDESATVLSKYREELGRYSQFVMPDYEHYTLGYDKHKLMAVCAAKGFPHPKTVMVENESLDFAALADLKFPVLIKPNYSSGARGITFVEKLEDLSSVFHKIHQIYGDCHIQEFISPGGNQVKVQLYVNQNQQLTQSSVIKKFRWYPEQGGSSCCNISTENDQIVDTCFQLLKEIGWIGLADFDTIEDPRTGELLIMELNPRLPACVKTAFAAGIDWGDVIVSEYLGLPHPTYRMEHNVCLRHLGFEMLWFYYSKNRFRTKPNWFKFLGRNIYYQDMNGWTDPMAFIRGTLGNVKKQLSSEFRQSKSGTTR